MTMIEPPHTEGMCLRQPVVEPLYDTRSEEDIMSELSERLGILDAYNEVINIVSGFHHKPELLLQPGRQYTDKEIAERKGLLWNDKPLDWYIEHGHAVTHRRPEKFYRPWEGMRLHFYIEDMVTIPRDLKAKMEEAGVPFRHEWCWDDYRPLPTAVLDPVHSEPPEYDLYGIFFKEIQINFGESLSNPWIKDIVYRDPVHIALILNPKTLEKQGLKSGDIVRVDSPTGRIYGRVGASEGMHPDALGVSNSLSRIKVRHATVAHAGGHFNDLLPYDLGNTDAVTGQPETVCKVKLTRLDDWPEPLKQGLLVYDIVDEYQRPGKVGSH
jgi:anaerobic selenocysteine-containing dehydrogenase